MVNCNVRTIVTILLLVPLICFGQKKKYNFEFLIFFGGCFNADSIDLKINGNPILSSRLRSSSIGTSTVRITQEKHYLNIKKEGKIVQNKKVLTNPNLRMDFILNGKQYSYIFNLKNGPIFNVQYCITKTFAQKQFTVTQQWEPILIL